jgi:hypothetical protein
MDRIKKLQQSLIYSGSGIIGWTDDGEAIPDAIRISINALLKPTKGYLFVAAKIFPSITQARKNMIDHEKEVHVGEIINRKAYQPKIIITE